MCQAHMYARGHPPRSPRFVLHILHMLDDFCYEREQLVTALRRVGITNPMCHAPTVPEPFSPTNPLEQTTHTRPKSGCTQHLGSIGPPLDPLYAPMMTESMPAARAAYYRTIYRTPNRILRLRRRLRLRFVDLPTEF
eukprot:7026647-Pyramimonas_sp.AAC.1